MNRRDLLKIGAVAGASLLLPVKTAKKTFDEVPFGHVTKVINVNDGLYHVQLYNEEDL